jgi:hypothetical protein
MDAGMVVSQVAAPTDDAFLQAEALIGHLPPDVLLRARGIQTVVPLVLGLLLAEEPRTRVQQHADLARHHGQALADATLQEGTALAGLHPLLRLPLAQIAFPALRQRSAPERQDILVAVSGLIHADGHISTFEYCLARLIYSELYESVQPKPARRSGRRSLSDYPAETATLLATLAHAGNPDRESAERAFAAGIGQIFPQAELPLTAPGIPELEKVWPALDAVQPRDKELLVIAAVAAIAQDGVMTVAEVELLRTICALLHCPLPPLGTGTGA